MPDSSQRAPRRERETAAEVEVATVATGPTRVRLTITGLLSGSAVPVLDTVLHIHLCAGRRDLRVDLDGAELSDAALRCLAESSDAAAALGGALVVENAPPGTARAITGFRRTPARA